MSYPNSNAYTNKPPPLAIPPKLRREQKHWSQRVNETVVSTSPEDGLGITLSGGADNGQFVWIETIKADQLTYHSGKLYIDDLILEIQGQKIAGYTLRDANIWLKQVSQNGAPVMIKSIKIGLLPKELRQFLTSRFPKGSVDHELQQTIRDNLYLRTVPCTTRQPRPGEVNGVDYTFLSMEEFNQLERSGCLLESGLYDGNHYGTPKPPSEPKGPNLRRSTSMGTALPNSGDNKRRRNRSNTEGGSARSSPVSFQYDGERKKSMDRMQVDASLGSLPQNWEKAFTEEGIPYFIDHTSETTHWLDPRLSKLQKQQAGDCNDDGTPTQPLYKRTELPFGWEKVEDPHYGTYYIDHVNRRTQYENPVTQAKRQNQGTDVNSTLPRTKKSQENTTKRSISDNNMNGRAPPEYHQLGRVNRKRERRVFTKNPAELKGEVIATTLVKSVRGFGFTIIGGDHTDEEFLQIKKVVENGPAHIDGTLQTGDVLVNVCDRCVLGYSHQDIVNLFQTIPAGQTVTLTVCRGYPLPFDPDDPNTEIIVTVAVNLPNDSNVSQPPPSYSYFQETHGIQDPHNTSAKSMKSLPDLTRSANIPLNPSSYSHPNGNGDAPDVLGIQKPEILTINIVRGEMGFGFTIADSVYGQKVKQILDKPRCKNLQEGDILQKINDTNVQEMAHSDIVHVLKGCPKNEESRIVVQRGGFPPKMKKASRSSPRSMEDNKTNNASDTSFSSSNQPGHYFFENHSHSADKRDAFDGVEPPPRPKTPSSESRPKTPTYFENRPKTPTRNTGMFVNDQRGKPPVARPPPRNDDYGKNSANQDLNISHGSSEFYLPSGNNDMSRPPTGSRFDPRSDHRPYGRFHDSGNSRSNFHDRDREGAKPGMFRSRTPGPEMINRGSEYRNEFQRPKTPTAHDMRSKTPLPGHSYGYSNSNHDFGGGHYQNVVNGRTGYGNNQRSWGQNPNLPTSPPPLRRGDTVSRNNVNNMSQWTGGFPPPRQSTSFEDVNPSPSNITQVPKRMQSHASLGGAGQSRFGTRFPETDDPIRSMEFTITLQKQEAGFGFRIIGGTEEGSQVSVGHIVPDGSADLDSRLRTGDEITHVDGQTVINSSHHRVVTLMTQAGHRGHVTLGVRRRVFGGHSEIYPYDVLVTRRETEGFGFVIISSISKMGSVIGECIDRVNDWLDRKSLYPWIGKIIENSPAERCGRLHIGDRILAVNGVDISHMHHEDIVNLIKDSGYSVTLTVGPPIDDATSNSSNSQKSPQGSMVNAMAYPAVPDSELRRFPPPPSPADRGYKDTNKHHLFSKHSGIDEGEYYVELPRGSRGFGFSIRGGQEFNCMPLFVLRIAEGGSADVDGRLRVGDQILEINGYKTDSMTHSDAIDIIQNGGQTVRLLVRRTGKLPPAFDSSPMASGYSPSNNVPMTNGPIGQSSPYLGRRNIDMREPNYFGYQGSRQYSG
ncbi:membrane-associated guanylate kinase, WW and PDZ domain-containing protein 1-like isoform X3 [Ostrea edulis]|uniref:membrane-associated guanylate kinase, WW and PDZ domain-containing protein 1-like isoform X3 n=1 Tax=Ostrea edulis TaxID=37623 RepID=UPI0020952959|nr:membrane-associated guanylate kinase, WW and PDZ domain-containing protein 1-like isoform X3 [Ostrea edulis]